MLSLSEMKIQEDVQQLMYIKYFKGKVINGYDIDGMNNSNVITNQKNVFRDVKAISSIVVLRTMEICEGNGI